MSGSFEGTFALKKKKYAAYSLYKGLADLGSILGVFFGLSLISIVEIFYFILTKYFLKNLNMQDTSNSKFGSESTIHGVKFIFNSSLHLGIRVSWALVLCLAFFGCIYNARQNYRKFAIEPETEITQQQISTGEDPFPAVTICTPIFGRKKSISTSNRFLNYVVFNPELLNVFTQEEWNHVVSNIQWMMPSTFLLIKYYNEMAYNISDGWYYRSEIDLVPYLNRSHYEIDEMFLECKFRGIPVICSEIIRRVMTPRGICYTYNMEKYHTIFNEEISKNFDSYGKYETEQEPQWTIDQGYKTQSSEEPVRALINNEVSFLLNINFDDYYQVTSDGKFYSYYLHLPNEIISQTMQRNFLEIDTDMLLTLSAKSKKSSESLRGFLPENRGCYFEDERSLQLFKAYTRSNCEVECYVNYTLFDYGCTAFFLPHNDSARICNSAWDLHMLHNMMTTFPEDIKDLCGCLPTCNDIEYSKKSEIISEMFQDDFER